VNVEHDVRRPPRDPATPEALQPLLDRLAADHPEGQAAPAARLAAAAYRRFLPEDLARLDVEETARQFVSAVAFMDARKPGTLALRVANPAGGQTTVVEVNVEDSPFLLSTINEELDRLDLSATEVVHPVVGVERTAEGRLITIAPARQATHRESYIRLQLNRRLDSAELEPLAGDLRRVLEDALAAARDFRTMLGRVDEVVAEVREHAPARYSQDEVDEAISLLAWLTEDHFVFLGYRRYDVVDHDGQAMGMVQPGSGLGILGDESSSGWARPRPLADLDPVMRERVEGGDLLLVSRTNRVSTVHRQVRMLYIGIKRMDETGAIVGEHRFLGLFAAKAYAEPASSIPVLRRKLRQILEAEDIVDHSFDERALRTLFEAFPKHDLFEADVDHLRRALVSLLESRKRGELRLILRPDPTGRSIAALVSLPRERFNAVVRQKIQRALVGACDAEGVDYHLSMSEGEQALLHFVLYPHGGEPPVLSAEDLEIEVARLTRTWEDDLVEALVEVHGEEEGRRLARIYGSQLPPGYTDSTSPAIAVADIAELEQLLAGSEEDAVRMALQVGSRADAGGRPLLRFKLYKLGAGVELSGFLPILESLGIVVVEEIPHRIAGMRSAQADTPWRVHIHDFGVRADGVDVDVERDGPRLAEAALAVWQRRAEADSLNRLVLEAGSSWQDVSVLRAYRRYRRQVGTTFTEAYQNEALIEHADVARSLVRLFAARFDPDAGTRGLEEQAVREEVHRGLEEVQRLDQDRILRGYLGVMDATVRTNFFRPDPRGALALKLDSEAVPDAPKPVPHVEVFVYSPELEGIHLRGGPVARGGIRWSDRLEDFRTEVLGLMKAQMAKNALIVPAGAKGGFVLKRPPADPAEVSGEVRRQYAMFVRALLDITDNIIDDKVVHPPGVRPADGEDPYLVVAADRGTATFSDLANSISEEYGFWLGDAFASGGSQGYDHKAMGITASGAWVAIERHFRELDLDVSADPVRVVGIGDMSGDVFGNGMLRSDRLQLVAAFDHRDIFVDPDPDPARSFAERRRMFELPQSSWQDYDQTVLSEGGGVWPRTVKRITVSPQMRSLLRIEAESVSPPELIRAILSAPVDLLFAGGIGTFVKSSTESHADAGDRVNDAIRVNADEVGARVIGEGGNLAVTQAGRIQYARRGGRCNTDSIDNAAGVDTSDREVNIKILLRLAVDRGALHPENREEALAALTEPIAALVLRDVYLQTWAISQEVEMSPGGLAAYEQFMADLEERGRLDRGVEGLPTADELIDRGASDAGLTRPELAVLLGYAKTDLDARLLESSFSDQDYFNSVLADYFPALVVERFGDLLSAHPLRRELVATAVANDLVNRMGITYASRTARELGVVVPDVAAAYWIAREVADADAHYRAVESLDGRVPPLLQLELKAEIDRILDVFVRNYLRAGATDHVTAAVRRDQPAFAELEKGIGDMGSASRRASRRARAERYLDIGVDPEVVERIVVLPELSFVPDVAAVARDSDQEVRAVADVFLRLTDALPLDTLQEHLNKVDPVGSWETWQHRGLTDELRELRRAAAAQAVHEHPEAKPAEAVQRFLSARSTARERADALMRQLEREPDAGLAAVAVAVRTLREVLRV
jgi:glutamate dehydrogenase